MTFLELNKEVCHTEAVHDECGVRLANVCHPDYGSLGVGSTLICTEDWGGLRCENVAYDCCDDSCLCC